MAITLKDVADKAGVSRSAVSRTFTDGASVSSKTRKKIERAAHELGYSPNIIARSLATNRTKLIGLVSNNFHNPVFLQVFDLFTRTLQDRELRPLLVNLSDETEPEGSVKMLKQYNVDGVIVASSTLPPSFSLAFKKAGLPVVHTFGRYSAQSQVHVVGIDNQHGGKLAAEALMNAGCSSIAFLGGPKGATSTIDRFAGFQNAIKAGKGKLAHSVYAKQYAYESGQAAMQSLLERGNIDGVFCGDDVLCMGALGAVRDAGISVPDDLVLIGFNDMEMAAWEPFSLTTIRQPIEQIISSSVDLIVTMLDEPERPIETRLFPCSVVQRNTL